MPIGLHLLGRRLAGQKHELGIWTQNWHRYIPCKNCASNQYWNLCKSMSCCNILIDVLIPRIIVGKNYIHNLDLSSCWCRHFPEFDDSQTINCRSKHRSLRRWRFSTTKKLSASSLSSSRDSTRLTRNSKIRKSFLGRNVSEAPTAASGRWVKMRLRRNWLFALKK